MWFQTLTGFVEQSPDQVRDNISIDGNMLTSLVNGNSLVWGELETPSLAELRKRVHSRTRTAGAISIREVIANVQDLHANASNAGSLFQVASQFNLLEMVSPGMTPERGVGIYEYDFTQGPACAIAAGAGTIYRNYFAPVNGLIGQSADNQIDCLADLGTEFGNIKGRLWEMKNGYCLPTERGLAEVSRRLQESSDCERDRLRGLLRIGLQWDTQVTLNDSQHKVSQAYCSALPVAYSKHSAALWQGFAELVLEASYEATFCAAIANAERNTNNRLFLTLLGGGAFGNDPEWIIRAIKRALHVYKDYPLDVAIVRFGKSNEYIEQLLNETRNHSP